MRQGSTPNACFHVALREIYVLLWTLLQFSVLGNSCMWVVVRTYHPILTSVIINFIELVSRFSRWLSIASLPTCTHVTLDEIIQRLSNPSSPTLETLQPGTLLADHPAVLNFKIARHKILVIPFVLQHHFKLKPCTHRGHVSEDPKP